MVVASASALFAIVLVAILFLRESDLPKPAPVSPFQHLDERKAAIYENLRDLQFEYRVGKLSDDDYQQTKTDLQKELARVLADVDRLKAELQANPQAAVIPVAPTAPRPATVCSNCGAEFGESLKFCGECGTPIVRARGSA